MPKVKVIVFAQNSIEKSDTEKISCRKYTAEFKAKG